MNDSASGVHRSGRLAAAPLALLNSSEDHLGADPEHQQIRGHLHGDNGPGGGGDPGDVAEADGREDGHREVERVEAPESFAEPVGAREPHDVVGRGEEADEQRDVVASASTALIGGLEAPAIALTCSITMRGEREQRQWDRHQRAHRLQPVQGDHEVQSQHHSRRDQGSDDPPGDRAPPEAGATDHRAGLGSPSRSRLRTASAPGDARLVPPEAG